jgi:GNAT superfamily N-acetyltransferase
MIKLEARDHAAVLGLYRASDARFPLVGAVLLDEQDGVVYVNDAARPEQAYVEHAFGFAQLLGKPSAEFESALERHLLIDRNFAAAKVRLYTPQLPAFLANARYESLRSWRQRFIMDPAKLRGEGGAPTPALPDTIPVEVDESNIAVFEDAFSVTRRFWRNASDFIEKANAVVVLHRGEPASICYAAAQADREAEIDVLTRPGHQRLGLGKVAVVHFVQRCRTRGLAPLWDCFTNNDASMQLGRSIGFTPKGPPYPFFTIGK